VKLINKKNLKMQSDISFRWVKRDSYLPVGSQNLKAVAKVIYLPPPLQKQIKHSKQNQ
jgi:hypothetical protein